MATSLSNLVNNLTEGIHKIKYKSCDCFLGYESDRDNLIKHKCLYFVKDYSNKIDEELKRQFKNTFKSSNNDINKFILLLRKGVYIDDWEKFDENAIREKEEYTDVDITDADYMHTKKVCKDFEIKNLSQYHDLYLKFDTLILADIFKNFRKMNLKICHLDLVKFLLVPRLA